MLEWLELEERVGRWWHRWASAESASYTQHPEASISLQQVAAPLSVFFRAAGGPAGVTVAALAARASTHRLSLRQRLGVDREILDQARLDEESLLLPPRIALFAERELNRDLYFWLAAHLAVTEPPSRLYQDPLRRDIAELREAVAANKRVLTAFPGLHSRYDRLRAKLLCARPRRDLPPIEAALEAAILHLLGSSEPLPDPASRCLAPILDPAISLRDFRAPDNYRRPLPVPMWAGRSHLGTAGRHALANDSAPPQSPAATGEVKHKRKAERRHQDQAEREDPLVFNRFEKILSLAEMVNVNRAVDDDEDKNASNNAEQMDEITLSVNRKRAASQLRIDLDLSPGAVDGERLRGEHTYPEWNFRTQSNLPDHCRVLTGVLEEAVDREVLDQATRRRIRRVRRQFEALRPRREWLRGQLDGSELDMDAVVRAHCDRTAMGQNSEGQYMAAVPHARDLAVSILVDTSLSTDAWVQDRRVIDIEKEALLVLALGLASCGDDYCIQSFTSRRRRQVWVHTVKFFEEPMSEMVRRRIAALQPGQYTRMGTAIRHSADQLKRRPNRHRLLLVLSDGKPSDNDYYEGRYAVEDTRRAILDARRAGLSVFGITIDEEAQQYIAQLFGPGGYAMVHKPEHLSQALPGIYRQLVGS